MRVVPTTHLKAGAIHFGLAAASIHNFSRFPYVSEDEKCKYIALSTNSLQLAQNMDFTTIKSNSQYFKYFAFRVCIVCIHSEFYIN